MINSNNYGSELLWMKYLLTISRRYTLVCEGGSNSYLPRSRTSRASPNHSVNCVPHWIRVLYYTSVAKLMHAEGPTVSVSEVRRHVVQLPRLWFSQYVAWTTAEELAAKSITLLEIITTGSAELACTATHQVRVVHSPYANVTYCKFANPRFQQKI